MMHVWEITQSFPAEHQTRIPRSSFDPYKVANPFFVLWVNNPCLLINSGCHKPDQFPEGLCFFLVGGIVCINTIDVLVPRSMIIQVAKWYTTPASQCCPTEANFLRVTPTN